MALLPRVASDTSIDFDNEATTVPELSEGDQRLLRLLSPLASDFSSGFKETRTGIREKLKHVAEALNTLEEVKDETLAARIAPALRGGLQPSEINSKKN